MENEMTGKARRQLIITLIKESDRPLSGSALGKMCGVSRQVVVQDMALLRTEGYDIVSTARGYIIEKSSDVSRVLKVHHTQEQLEDELRLIVDHGGCVQNVMINHKVYGLVTANLNIRNRRDIAKFSENLKESSSTLLSNVTSGYHFHKISAESEEILDEIEQALKEAGYMAEVFPYEEEVCNAK